jgi:formylglycine-generating enzyme required for sulfatase activity
MAMAVFAGTDDEPPATTSHPAFPVASGAKEQVNSWANSVSKISPSRWPVSDRQYPSALMTFRPILTAAAALLTSVSSASAADPVVSNLSAAQRPGTKLVDITYDLTADTSTVKVSLQISSDGGTTYNVPVTAVSGAIGNGVTVGTGKTITWDAGVDWDGKYSPQTRFRVVADDLLEGFALIPAGAFTMGDVDYDARPVTITVSAFYMGKYEVTKAEWSEVREWAAVNGYTDLAEGGGKASNHPVHTISWHDIVKWCNARSQKEGLTPVYTVSGAVMKTGTTAPVPNWSANGYRLPTEAEWEKAARGGVSGKRFPWGTDTISHAQANYYAYNIYTFDLSGSVNGFHPSYNDGTPPYTSPAGAGAANNYGLYDMAGNVWEWCWDWYGESTYVSGATDPRGPAWGAVRAYRGGSWLSDASVCRVANRNDFTPTSASSGFGFRVARSSAP